MILNENGKSFEYDGIIYTIGDTIIGTNASEYEGLIGTITEIRDGTDKETENETPDIYCSFEVPIFPEDVKHLEETFSDLYDEPKTIDDIVLDMVIMAPEMVISTDKRHQDTKKIKVYAVTEDWANNDNYGYDMTLFATEKEAMKEFKTIVATESLNGIISDIKCSSSYVEEIGVKSYECYIDGFQIDNHYTVTVKEKELQLTPSCMEQVKRIFQPLIHREDFISQIIQWPELELLTDAQYKEMINDPEVPERIANGLSKNDSYWDAYWETISEVAHQIVREYTKEVSK